MAGVGTFLLAAGRATGERRYLSLAVNAAVTLTATAEPDGTREHDGTAEHDGASEHDGMAAYWPTDLGGQRRTHWCNGSSGAGTFLLRVRQHTGEQRFSELATQAAAAVHRARWRAGPSQCHSLAGDAEFLIDLAKALGHARYRTWASELAGCISLRPHGRPGGAAIRAAWPGSWLVPGKTRVHCAEGSTPQIRTPLRYKVTVCVSLYTKLGSEINE